MKNINYLAICFFCITGCVSKIPSNGFFEHFEFIGANTNKGEGRIKYVIDKKWLDWSVNNKSDIFSLRGGSANAVCSGELKVSNSGFIAYQIHNGQKEKSIRLDGNGSIICKFNHDASVHKIELMASPNKLPFGDSGEVPIGVTIDFENYKTKINP